MSEDCLFCRIIKGDIPSKKIWEDQYCLAFLDIQPQAPGHALIVPRRHAPGLNNLDGLTDTELAACLRAADTVAGELGIREGGYRLVSNCGGHACQSVPHLHFHVIGGRQLTGQMG